VETLSLVHDLVDTSRRNGGGGGTAAASGVHGDESLARSGGPGGVAECRDSSGWFRGTNSGVLVLRILVPGGIGVPVEFPEGASGVEGVVASGRLLSSIFAVRAHTNAFAHSPFVGGSGGALLFVLFVGVATTAPMAAGELGVTSGAERHIMTKLVASVTLAEDGVGIELAGLA
jgi:hypothetical protein